MILTSVDLPAPVSPTSACTVPRRTVSRARRSTFCAPKLLSSAASIITSGIVAGDASLIDPAP